MKTSPEEDVWTKYFEKLVKADQQIVKSLDIHLSYLNENIYKNVASLYNNRLIPADKWSTIQMELKDYLQFLNGLDFPNMLWNRTFLGNPFQSIFIKLKFQRFVLLNRNALEKIFKDAYQTVENAHEQIMIIIDNLKGDLEDQRVETRNVVVALDDLNGDLLIFEMNIGQSTIHVEKLIKSLQIVSDAVRNFRKPKMSLNCFAPATSWKVQLMNQLNIIENAHKQLDVAIGTLN